MMTVKKIALVVCLFPLVLHMCTNARAEEALCHGKRLSPQCGCYRERIQYPLDGSRGFICLARPVVGWGKLQVVTTHWRGDFEGWYNVLGYRLPTTGSRRQVVIDKHEEHPRSAASTEANQFVPPNKRFAGSDRSIAIIPPSSDLRAIEHRIWNERGTGCVHVSIHEVDLFQVGLKALALGTIDIVLRILLEELSPSGPESGKSSTGNSRLIDAVGSALSTAAFGTVLGTSKQAIAAEIIAKLALDEALAGLPKEERIMASSMIGSFVGTLVDEIFKYYDRDLSRDAVAGGRRAPECRSDFRHAPLSVRMGG